MTASTATTLPSVPSASVRVRWRTADGSVSTRPSSRWRSGHSSAAMMPPTTVIFATPLAKLTSAWRENRRLRPAAGEIFESCGRSDSADQTKRCWIMLPATAASISSRNGIATAAIASAPMRASARVRPLASIAMPCTLPTRPRKMVARPAPIEPEKIIRLSAAAAMTNQVLTSWLLTTSPRSIASSSRFWVGSSERSAWSRSSATGACSGIRRELAQHAFDVTEEDRHHRADDENENEKADQDRQRDADEEHLHLRHQPRQHAEPEVEQQPEHQERRGELHADPERAGGRGRDQRGDVAHERNLARLEQHVAVVERGDEQVMQVGGEQHGDAEDGEEVADQHALLPLGRVDRGDEAEAELLGDDAAGDLQRRDGEPRGEAEHGADQQLLAQRQQDRAGRAQVDRVGGTVQRQQHGGEHQRHHEAHPRRHAQLAQRRQQHHHGADAREHQHEGGGERRQEGDVDAHQPPMMRPTSRAMWLASASPMNGSAISMVMKMARIFGTKTSVISWIWVSAWNSEMATPTASPTSISGADTSTSVMIASRATSSTSGPVISVISHQ